MGMTYSSSRLIPVVLGAVLVFGACGGDDAPSGGSIDSVGEQPGLRAPSPIQITGGSTAGAGSLGAAASEAAVVSSDAMIAPVYWISEYVVGDGMPALPTNDLGYVFDASLEVTAEQVARVAAALGVTGEPVPLDEGFGVSWRVGPDDGSAPTLWVSNEGTQSWNYSAWQGRGAIVSCTATVDSDGTESSDCPEPEPPIGVPTEAEAQQRASELMAALGHDVSLLEIETYGDEWFASVMFSDGADDRAALREWSFGFGADGVLEYASGALAQAEPVGPYPLIDLDTALARLDEGSYGFGGPGLIEPGIAIAAAPPVDAAGDSDLPVAVPESDIPASDVEPGVEGGTEGDQGGEASSIEPMPVEPMPVEPMPEPEPVVVTLVDVQADLWWAWDIDGSVWLLPAYRFIDGDGGWHVVPAVTDEYMIHVDPPIMVDEPLPAPEPPAGELDQFDASVLEPFVGLTVVEFTAEAERFGASVRIVEQDGVGLAITADFSSNRVNVAADGDTVIRIDSVG
jgi:hypothetical protein